MFSNTIVGTVAHLKVVEHDGEFLAVTLYVKDKSNSQCSIKFNNNNGLLTAYNNGTLVVGQQLILTQWEVRINSIRTHYTKDNALVPLKYPEISLVRVYAVIGALPMAKQTAALAATEVEPVIDELPF